MKTEKTNWQPEHFPVGTIVEMAEFHVSPSGEIKTCTQDPTYVKLQAKVTAVVKNGLDSYCIITDIPNHPLIGVGFRSFNIDHIGRIIKRGDGPVVYAKKTRYKLDTKNSIGDVQLSKGCYYWTSTQELLTHITGLYPFMDGKYVKEEFTDFLISQSFVKRITYFSFYKVYKADKKKLRNFIRRNFNRWQLSCKEIKALEKAYDDEIGEMMDSYLLSDFDYLQPKVTKGINEHGLLQAYLNDEPVCIECHKPYENTGTSPLAAGIRCVDCTFEEIVETIDKPWMRGY